MFYFIFHLQLNDYLELQDYPQLLDVPAGQMCTLKIVPELYDERASRLHVRRLRELLVKPPAHIQPSAVQAGYEMKDDADSTAVAVSKKGKGKKGKKSDDPFEEFAPSAGSGPGASPISYTDSFSLTSYHAASRSRAQEQAQASLVDAVRNVSFSGWNPPPGNRALQGDLSYLEITTAEGLQAHVTANQEGFYLNQSTSSVFNPERAETHYKSLTLVELLRKISPSFQSKWHKV